VPAAMASGQLPIGVTYEPSLSQILGQGGGKKFKVVFSSKNAPGLIADVMVFDDKVIKAKPTEISGLIKAYLDGMAYMKAKPDDAAKIIGKNVFEARALAAADMNQSQLRTTEMLWEDYKPHLHVWIPFGIIGILATIALGIFGQMAKRWKDMNV